MRLSLALLLAFISVQLSSQDILILRNGDEVEATVSKVTLSEIEYSIFNSTDSSMQSINKSDVFLIKYSSGVVSLINNEISNKSESENTQSDTPILYPYDGSQIAGVVGAKYIGAGVSALGVIITTLNDENVGTVLIYGGSMLYTACQIIQDIKTATLGHAVGDLYDQERRRFGISKKKKNIEDPAHNPEWEFLNPEVKDEENVELGPLKLTVGCALIYTNKEGIEFEATLKFYDSSNRYYFIKYINEFGKTKAKTIYPKNYNKIRLAD
jgi:hypothetical protein